MERSRSRILRSYVNQQLSRMRQDVYKQPMLISATETTQLSIMSRLLGKSHRRRESQC